MATNDSGIDSTDDGGNIDSSLQLRDHLETLPQELYDHIYDLTFTAEPAIRFYASKKGLEEPDFGDIKAECSDYVFSINEKLPLLFHVDRRSREKFAKSYFGHEHSFFLFYGNGLSELCFESSHLNLIPQPRYTPPSKSWTMAAELCQLSLEGQGWPRDVVKRIEVLYACEVPYMLAEDIG